MAVKCKNNFIFEKIRNIQTTPARIHPEKKQRSY